jgi:sugar lactone lactonase YvrE
VPLTLLLVVSSSPRRSVCALGATLYQLPQANRELEHAMSFRRDFLKCCAILLVASLALTPAALGQDVLYIGDGGDDTIKMFDAASGAFLAVSEGPAVSGLKGPRGIVLDGDELLVVNQNVGLPISGEVLRFDAATGAYLGARIPFTTADAPFAPDGLVLEGGDLFVANLQRKDNAGPPGRINQYTGDGTFLGAAKLKNNEHHPRGVVFGPDGLLYVSTRDLTNGLGGTVLRFSPDGKGEVFIDDQGGAGQLNRPDGLVFGPDGRLYITSFRAAPGDTDSVRIYDAGGGFAGKFDLHDGVTQPRVFAQSLLFGPEGKLFVPINNTGEVRRYDGPTTGDYDVLVPPVASGGVLLSPVYMTFGQTNASTFAYEE